MYYNARYYDATIGRFIQPDSLADPYIPQTLNRYSYVRNNPVKYTDPTGHCDGDATDAGNPDAACWNEYRDVVGPLGLGYDVPGLDTWKIDALAGLNGWLKAGVRFTSNPATYIVGEAVSKGVSWTADGLGKAISALKKMTDAGLDLDKALGGLKGYTINSVTRPPDRNNITGWQVGMQINLDITADIEGLVWHESGHRIDQVLGSGSYWSDTSTEWKNAGGWHSEGCILWVFACQSYRPSVPGIDDTNPREDFATIFERDMRSGDDRRFGSRFDALNVALGKFKRK